jgi:hypothetical protein
MKKNALTSTVRIVSVQNLSETSSPSRRFLGVCYWHGKAEVAAVAVLERRQAKAPSWSLRSSAIQLERFLALDCGRT